MGIIIKKKQKNKTKNIKKQRSLKLLSKKLQNKKTQNKNKKLKAQSSKQKQKNPQNKNKNSKPKKSQKKQRRTHLSSTSPKNCSRCPNFKKQEKHNCHLFETLKEVPIQ